MTFAIRLMVAMDSAGRTLTKTPRIGPLRSIPRDCTTRRQKGSSRPIWRLWSGRTRALHPPLVVEPHLLGDGSVEFVDGKELSVAQGRVYIVIGQFDVVLDKGLVLRLARPGRYGHAAEVFCEVLHRAVDLRLVPVRFHYGRLQVIRHDDLRDAADVPQAALQGVQEVVHLLRRDRHRKAVVGRRKRRHEHLALHFLSGIEVRVGHRIAGKVHEQVLPVFPVWGKHERRLLGLRILIDMVAELRVSVPVRPLHPVFPPEQIHRHVLPLQFRRDVRKTLLEILEAVVAVCGIASCQHPLDLRLLHRQEYRDGDAAGLRQRDIFVDRTLVQVQFPAYRTVRLSVQMKTQRLFDLVHFFTFTCHGSLNFWLSCKVNEQVGGYAPKSFGPQAVPLQKWVHMLRKGGAPDAFLPLSPAPGWSCSAK